MDAKDKRIAELLEAFNTPKKLIELLESKIEYLEDKIGAKKTYVVTGQKVIQLVPYKKLFN